MATNFQTWVPIVACYPTNQSTAAEFGYMLRSLVLQITSYYYVPNQYTLARYKTFSCVL